jgi:putative peptidoglycan lipid II flippase
LSDHKFQENKIGFNSLIKNTSDLASLILFPIMIIMFINSIDIVRIVYQRGAFSAEDTIVTSYVLKLLSVSLIFVSLREILVRVFYSKNDTKTPMINGIFAVFINVILSIFLSRIYGLNGIVIATTISTILSSVIIIILAKIKLGVIPTNFSAFTISKILMIFLIVFLFSFYFKISSLPTFFNLVANSLVTLVMYFILLIMFKIDIKALIMFMKKRS